MVLPPSVLPTCYAMPGTDLGHAASGTVLKWGMALLAGSRRCFTWYALCGTGLVPSMRRVVLTKALLVLTKAVLVLTSSADTRWRSRSFRYSTTYWLPLHR